MDRKIFEAGMIAKKEEMEDEAHGEALEMNKKWNLSGIRPAKGKVAEAGGKSEPSQEAREWIKEWQDFYKKIFSQEVDLSGVEIPKRTPEQEKNFTRLIVMAPGLTMERLFKKYEELFGVMNTERIRFDEHFRSDRSTEQAYAVWVRDNRDADEEQDCKSADKIKEEGLLTETLEERFLQGLKFFEESGHRYHLDISSTTLCSGSRWRGAVPVVRWLGGKFGLELDIYDPSVGRHGLRAREVIVKVFVVKKPW